MAPQMVHPDPAQALAKVRSVPRGRVPIFLVGDAADEPRMAGLADGFFIRPVSPDELLERARAVLTACGQGRRQRRRGAGQAPAEGMGAGVTTAGAGVRARAAARPGAVRTWAGPRSG